MDVRLRAARPQDAPALSALAFRSKASWGYSAEFMEACRQELTLTPEQLAAWTVWVAEVDGVLAGMIALRPDGEAAELEALFVDPGFQGRGVGAALMRAFLDHCENASIPRVRVDADPNAEAVYARFGFRTIGRSPSGSIPGRTLPRMELLLSSH